VNVVAGKFCFETIISYNYSVLDVNECSEGLSNCSQSCFNTLGSYNCICYAGFILSNDAWSHKSRYQMSACKSTLNGGCSDLCNNIHVIGSFYCSCDTDYSFTTDKYTLDITAL
uniref:EGF-like calcium-binding domain-containing protein n=1 Tax=Amphimedon queenslandica TaxID=400682 RepID=A0A1X7TNR0_AMPQE